nr:LytTR family DNA-binding domain-containing protein [Motilimonas eburnea]
MLIDDEPAATKALQRSLNAFEQLEVIGCYQDPQQGIDAICELTPDIVFMDIEMPGLDGLMVAKATEHIPYHLIYVTAYAEYALSAFETKVIDYLLKPVRPIRIERCLEKIEQLSSQVSAEIASEILIFDGKTTYRLADKDISFIESIGRYQQVNLTPLAAEKFQLKTIVTEATMASFEADFASNKLVRVHRSYIVNLNLVIRVHRESRNTLLSLMDVTKSIPVARAKVALINQYFDN